MKEVLDHVLRSLPPWRPDVEATTECGRDANDVASVLSRSEMIAKLKDQGRTRASLTSCMTCWQTADRWPTWDSNPMLAMEREIARARWGDGTLIEREFQALTELYHRHSDEFHQLVESLSQVESLDARRRTRRSRNMREGRT